MVQVLHSDLGADLCATDCEKIIEVIRDDSSLVAEFALVSN